MNNTNIKQYQKITMIKLKTWRLLRTTATKEEVQALLNNREADYLEIDGVGFSRLTGVAEFFEFVPDDIECFILSQEPEVKERLRWILKEREEKNHKTNGISHLREIYEKRFLQGSTN